MKPAWLALFAPLPQDAPVQRKPVLPAELAQRPESEAVAGWESVTLHLSLPVAGLRHCIVTLDAQGVPISASDGVLYSEDGLQVHENVGGRLEADGRFLGTRWRTVMREVPGQDEAEIVESVPFAPSAADAEAIKRLVAELLRRS